MAWIQLRLETKQQYAEPLSNALSATGAQAVTFLDAKDTPILEPKPGEIHYWPETIVIGLFDAEHDMQAVTELLLNSPLSRVIEKHKVEALEDKDWEREWMDNFHPMQFGQRLWICPSWRPVPEPDAVNVMLDPGLAFGTGTHPTTALCLEWLDGLDLTDKTVVDFGCGSGILGIAALKLGAKRVIGIDIDPQALQASKENARRNGVDDKLELYLPEDQPELKVDVVVANILAGPLKELRDIICGYLGNGASLALSGILDTQAEDVKAYYGDLLTMEEIKVQDEWARLTGHTK